MSVIYRTVFTDSRADLISEGRRLFEEWLVQKGIEVDLPDAGAKPVAADGVGEVSVLGGREADLEALRLRLDEERDGDRWTTVLTLMTTADESWVWIDLERVSDEAYGPPPLIIPPRLVRSFLESSDCRAGPTRLTARHRGVDEGGLDELVEELLDPVRTIPVLVVSKDDQDPGAVEDRAFALARTVIGVANVWSLRGYATSALSRRLGEGLHVYGGAVRTYLPGLAVPDRYPSRHRYARRELFLPDPRRGAQVIARAVVGMASGTRPPVVYRERVSSLQGFARHGDDADSLLNDLLAVEGERDRLQESLDLTMLEAAEAESRVDDLEARVPWLEGQLAEHGAYVVGVPTPLTNVPVSAKSCLEALEFADQHLDRLVVGDTLETAEELDQHPKGETWGQKAWRALRALQQYAEAKAAGEFDGTFMHYCRTGLSGRSVIPSEWVAMNESETTNNNSRFRSVRTFPVPSDVLTAGEAYMAEHIRLEKGSDPAPRMHYWDDTGGSTGRIYVGYLGRHLPSAQTN